MKLATYIAERRGAASDLARRLGVNHATVLRWASGRHAPTLAMCERISQETGGAVTVQDFLSAQPARVA